MLALFERYLRSFTSLMLETKDMFEEDKLFNFISILQSWAQTELKRQRVQNLASALSTAQSLFGYKAVGDPNLGHKKKDAGMGKGRGKGKEKEKRGGSKNWKKKGDGDHSINASKESHQTGECGSVPSIQSCVLCRQLKRWRRTRMDRG